MIDGILTLDSGERGLKFSVFTLPASQNRRPRRVLRGVINAIGPGRTRFNAWDERGQSIEAADLPAEDGVDHDSAVAMLSNWIKFPAREVNLIAVAHRVVHGAQRRGAERLTDEGVRALRELTPLAPAHQPHNLDTIDAARRYLGEIEQIACFDTAFHRSQPEVAQSLPLPAELGRSGIISYGFNGLAFESITTRIVEQAQPTPRRIVIAHLGQDASMCAIRNGRSVACSHGFSLIEGLPTGTRCGRLDPGVLLYLMREEGYTLDQLEHLLYKRSGLLGVSGFSADMRVLLESKFPRAAVAVELFCYRVIRELGSLAAALQGLDALVFTGRVGVSAAPVRAAVCRNARWLGIELDEAANLAHRRQLHQAASRVQVWSMPAEVDWVMAQQAQVLLARSDSAVGVGGPA